jgi:hypothetical protein
VQFIGALYPKLVVLALERQKLRHLVDAICAFHQIKNRTLGLWYRRSHLHRRRGDRISAAKLALILAGESPANSGCPVAVVVISSNGKGDRPVESLEVKAPGGRSEYRSDPYSGASNLAGRSECAN